MHYLLTLVLTLFLFNALSQGPPPPPPAAIADDKLKPLIKEVAESCHYELYFEHYKDSLVQHYAEKHEWDKQKVQKIKEEIIFTFSRLSINNAYAFTSESELERIKEYNLSLSKRQVKNLETIHNDLIIHNMINSLEWKCKSYIE